ncbi:FecR family protein [bacterium]|nr:FecR family protein [bacterium]
MTDNRDKTERLLERAAEEWAQESRPSKGFSMRMKDALREEAEKAPAPKARVIPIGWKSWVGIAAVLMLMATGIVLIRQYGRERADLLYAAGSVEGAQKVLREGDSITTKADGKAIAQLDDGRVVVLLAADSKLDIVGEDRLRLEHGDLWVNVEPESGFFEVTTPNARVTVQGTKFGVSHGSGGTRVILQSGRISLEAGSSRQTLSPGESALVEQADRPPIVADKVADVPAWVRDLQEEFMKNAAAQRYPSGWSTTQ